MEIVKENEETISALQKPNTLDEERNRMQMNLQNIMSRTTGDNLPAMPTRAVMRQNSNRGAPARGVPARANSMRIVRPSAPTKSTDTLSSMRGSSLQRANSSRVLLRANSSRAMPPRRAPPGRTNTSDSTSSLRAFRRDQVVNSAIEPKDMTTRMRGPGSTLQRHESDVSLLTSSDLSCFTMDSVNLRKTQLVADPLDDISYNDADSYADHESISRASHFSQFTEYPPPPRSSKQMTTSDDSIGPIRFDKLQISGGDDGIDEDDRSFGSMTSGLTTDFTEHELLDSFLDLDGEGDEVADE